MPVIFHTGWPSHVDTSPNPFVKVVTRGDDPKALRKAVSEVFESHLPQFVRHLEHAQREYMWDFMEQNWTKLDVATTDLAYLLARRLAAILGRRSVREFLEQHGGASLSPDEEGLVHPVEMYVYPPLEYSCFAGDIVVCPTESSEQYWVVLTPSCDFENNKAEHILLAFCDLLANVKEFSDAAGAKNAGSTPAKRAIESLTNLLKDNHGQQDRRKFLPGTFFLPDLVVDFQNLRCVSKEKFGDWTVITSLDTPFGEALIARFARFYGRIGTPNLSVESVLNRLGIL